MTLSITSFNSTTGRVNVSLSNGNMELLLSGTFFPFVLTPTPRRPQDDDDDNLTVTVCVRVCGSVEGHGGAAGCVSICVSLR